MPTLKSNWLVAKTRVISGTDLAVWVLHLKRMLLEQNKMGLNPAVAFFVRGFSRRIACLLLSIFLAPSAVSANENCENELLAVTTLVNMVKNALIAGELKANEVTLVFENGKWGNPFAVQSRSLINVHRRGAFSRISNKFSPGQKDLFRAKLRKAMDQAANVQGQVAKASATAKFIVHPQILYTLPADFENSGINLFAMGRIENRPVFVGLMSTQGRHSYYLIDYFNKDLTKTKVQPVGDKQDNSDTFNKLGKIFRWNGVDYYIELETQTFIDLKSGANAKTKFTKLQAPRHQRMKMALEGWEVLPNAEGAMSVVAAWNSKYPELRGSFLGFVSLDSRGYTFNAVKEGQAASPLGVNLVDGQAIISWIPRNENRVDFFQLGVELELLGSVPVPSKEVNAKRTPLVYAMNRKLLAMIPYDDPATERKLKLGVFDVREQRFLRDIKLTSFATSKMELIHVNGRPTVKMVGPETVTFIDAATEKVFPRSTPRLRSEPVAFDFQGRTYILWGTDDSKLEVFAESWHFVGTLDIGAPALQTLVFEIGGEPVAFVPRVRKPPVFVRLVNNEQELRW